MARLLVSNHTPGPHGGVYLLDTHAGRLSRLCEVPTRGLTRGPDGFYFVENEGTVFHLDPESWKVTRRAATGFGWCHDLRWFGDEFGMVASRGNRVVRLDRSLRVVDTLQIVEDENDVCHANSVERVGQDTLVSIFTLQPGIRASKRHTDGWRFEGKILRLDWGRRGFDVLYEPLAQPHSLLWRDGLLYTCESLSSWICAIDVVARSRRPLTRLHGFVRGLAFGDGIVYAGISHCRLKSRSPWARLRQWLTSWNGVVLLDPETWAVKKRFRLPGTQVYDVLPVDGA